MLELLAPGAVWEGRPARVALRQPEEVVDMWLERSTAGRTPKGLAAAADSRGATLYLRTPVLVELDSRPRNGVDIRVTIDDAADRSHQRPPDQA
jgi:hypothetical protein